MNTLLELLLNALWKRDKNARLTEHLSFSAISFFQFNSTGPGITMPP